MLRGAAQSVAAPGAGPWTVRHQITEDVQSESGRSDGPSEPDIVPVPAAPRESVLGMLCAIGLKSEV